MAIEQCKRSSATVEWGNLPPDILSSLAGILNSDVDNLRLRSVCSSWRSSLPLPHKPFSFPLKLPPLSGNNFLLDEITLYRLSPPADEDGCSSNGWLLSCYFDCIEDLKGAFFILSDHASHSFNAKDFPGFKGNRAYAKDECFDLAFKSYDFNPDYDGDMLGAYDFEDSGKEVSPPCWLPG